MPCWCLPGDSSRDLCIPYSHQQPLKGSLNRPKKGTKNCQVFVFSCFFDVFFDQGRTFAFEKDGGNLALKETNEKIMFMD